MIMVVQPHQLLLLLVQPALVDKQRLLLLLVQLVHVDKQRLLLLLVQLVVVDKQHQLVPLQPALVEQRQVQFLQTTLIHLLQVARTVNIVIVFAIVDHIVTMSTGTCIGLQRILVGVALEG
jgi:hypothetical protein